MPSSPIKTSNFSYPLKLRPQKFSMSNAFEFLLFFYTIKLKMESMEICKCKKSADRNSSYY